MQNKINELTLRINSVNNEHLRAVDKIKILKEQKKNEKLREKIKHDFTVFDEDGIHKDTGKHYDLNDFDSYGINVKTNDKYNPEGFDIKGFHKDTKNLYDPNSFNINGNHVITNDKYIPEGFDIKVFLKDTKNLYDPNGFDRNVSHV